MPECDVCGSDDYYQDDGNYFCNVCNTQSQSMAVIELDDAKLSQIPKGLMREIPQGQKKRKKCCEYDAGRPWTRYEAYQLILQGQADALIAHGAHPSVEEVVQRLYFAYLRKLEVAFVGERKTRLIPKGLEKSEHCGWHRELHRGGLENPEVNPKALKRKILRNMYRTGRGEKERESMADTLAGEVFYEGDNPFDREDSNDDLDRESDLDLPLPFDSEEDSDDDDCDEEEEKLKLAKRTRHSTPRSKSHWLGKQGVRDSIQYMNLRKTLSFLYTACLFASPWVTVSDILRWVSDGSLPYLETSHLLHSDMKLSAYDQHLFKPASVTSEVLRLDAGNLLRLLDISQIPPFLMEDIAIKYTLLLDLPEALVPYVISVVEKCPKKFSSFLQKNAYTGRSLPNVDALCAAYILLTLKAIFCLDDDREQLLSEYTKEAQKKTDIPLFDWQEWQWHASRKFLMGSGTMSTTLGQEGGEEDSVEALCQAFNSAQYKEQNYSHSKLFHRRKKGKTAPFKQENREMLKRPASVLEDCWKNRDATAARIRAEERDEHSADATSGEKHPVHFRDMSMQHLLQVEDFLQALLGEEKASENSPDTGETLVMSERECVMSEALTSTPASGHDWYASVCSDSESHSPVTGRRTDGTPPRKRRKIIYSTEKVIYSAESRKKSSDVGSQNKARSEDADSTSEEADWLKKPTESRQSPKTVSQLLRMQSKVSKDYWVCPQQTGADAYRQDKNNPWWQNQSCSYKWLLRILSTLVHCPYTHIQRMVCELEQALLDR